MRNWLEIRTPTAIPRGTPEIHIDDCLRRARSNLSRKKAGNSPFSLAFENEIKPIKSIKSLGAFITLPDSVLHSRLIASPHQYILVTQGAIYARRGKEQQTTIYLPPSTFIKHHRAE